MLKPLYLLRSLDSNKYVRYTADLRHISDGVEMTDEVDDAMEFHNDDSILEIMQNLYEQPSWLLREASLSRVEIVTVFKLA